MIYFLYLVVLVNLYKLLSKLHHTKCKSNAIELKENINKLEENFSIISQKWSLEILYTLLLKDHAGFGEIKKILGVNSRTLSDKLKTLSSYKYINRKVDTGPPLRVQYSLTSKGKNTVLLALPLLYYSSK